MRVYSVSRDFSLIYDLSPIFRILQAFYTQLTHPPINMCFYVVTAFSCGHQTGRRHPCPLREVGYPTFLLPCEYTEHDMPPSRDTCGDCTQKASRTAAIPARRVSEDGQDPRVRDKVKGKPAGRSADPAGLVTHRSPVSSETSYARVQIYKAFDPQRHAADRRIIREQELRNDLLSLPRRQSHRPAIGSIAHIQEPRSFLQHAQAKTQSRLPTAEPQGQELFFHHSPKRPDTSARCAAKIKKSQHPPSLVAGRRDMTFYAPTVGQVPTYYHARKSRRKRVKPAEIRLITIPEGRVPRTFDTATLTPGKGARGQIPLGKTASRADPEVRDTGESRDEPETNGLIILNEYIIPNIKHHSLLHFEGTILEDLTKGIEQLVAHFTSPD